MSKKQENIQKLYKARTEYLKWLNNIKFLISGVYSNNEVPQPILHESEVGKWFYSDALQFGQFNSRLVLDEMEKILEEIYDVYSNIYTIFNTSKDNKLKTLFGFRKGISAFESKKASEYYEQIILLSDKFKYRLKSLESQLMALDDEKHDMIQDFNKKSPAKIDTPELTNNESLKEYNYGPRG